MSGFTLTELLITLAVVAILAAFAMPSFDALIKGNRVTASTNDLIAAIQYARSEAAVRGYPIVLCNGNAAGTACSSSQKWTNDLLAIEEKSSTEKNVLRVFPKPPESIQVSSPSSTLKDLRFKSNGSIEGFIAGTGSQSFSIQPKKCKSGKELRRELRVTFLGHTKAITKACS